MLDLKVYIYILKLKAAEVEVKQCKKDVDAAKKQWGAKEAEEAALTMEIDELKKAIDEGRFVSKFLLGSKQVQNTSVVMFWLKIEKIFKGSLDSIPSPSPSFKIQIMGGKVCLRCTGKTLLGVVNILFVFKSLLTSPSNVLPYYL